LLERGARIWENVAYPASEGVFVCTDVATLRQCLLGAPIEQFGLVVELTVKVIAEQEVDIKGGERSRCLPEIPRPSFHVICAENPLPASVVKAPMKTRGVCVMHAQRAMHVVKRCYCR